MDEGQGNNAAMDDLERARQEWWQHYTLARPEFGWNPYCTLLGRIQIGPATVPDDDGQEHVLLHVFTISGQWLWSSIEPEYAPMGDLQAKFAIECRHLNDDVYMWFLMWDAKEKGPYPAQNPWSDEPRPPLPDYNFDESLRYATGLQRSEDTQEVFVTAYRAKIAEALSW